MHSTPVRAFFPTLIFGLGVSLATTQEKPLARAFLPGSSESYRVQVTLRVEARGATTETIGEKTYVKPIAHNAEAMVGWTSTRHIASVSPDGTAQIEEAAASFSSQCPQDGGGDAEAQKLRASLLDICSFLQSAQTFQYQERADGMIGDLPVDARLVLGEDGPALLALWLRRNLRPSVIFPALPFRPGARTQRPIRSAEMIGSETTEWAEGIANTAVLHVVQELSWVEPALKNASGNLRNQSAGKTAFFADSSTAVSLLDGGIVTSTRTASRETRRILDPVEGLPQSPEFSSKLSIVVTVRRIP